MADQRGLLLVQVGLRAPADLLQHLRGAVGLVDVEARDKHIAEQAVSRVDGIC